MKRIIFICLIYISFFNVNAHAKEESIFVWGETDVVVLHGEELTDILIEIKSHIKLKEGYADPDFYIDNNNVNYTTQSTINTKIIGIYRLDHRAVSPKYNKKEIRSYYLHVIDKEPPKIISSKSFTMPIYGNKPDFKKGFIVKDNVTIENDLIVIIDDTNVNYNKIGNYEVIYTVMDEFGNTTIHIETITIVDLIKPTITIKAPFIIEVNEEFNIEDFFIIEDNYDQELEINIEIIGNVKELGEFMFILTVTDSSGNKEILNGELIVVDETPPIINLEYDVVEIEVHEDEYDYLSIVEVYDNYDELTIYDIDILSEVNYNEVGVYEVLYKVVDSSNNETIETLTMLVKDNTSPLIIVDDLMFNQNEVVDLLLYVKVEDNYSSPNNISLRIIYNNINFQSPGIYNVTYEAIDESGNHTHKTINVTIIGQTKEKIIFYVLACGVSVFAVTIMIVYFVKKRKKTY